MVRKYSHLVYSIALKCGLGREESEDVFQAVFLALLRNIESLEQIETLIPWLVTTTKRQSWKASRGESRRASASEEALESLEDPTQ